MRVSLRLPLASALVALALLPSASPAAQDVPAAERYWVFFRDRDGAAASAPAATERALARRALRGTPAAWADAPVAPRYVAALRALGAEPVVESRWLNAVTVRATPAARAALAALPFVRGLRPVAGVERTDAPAGAAPTAAWAGPTALGGGPDPGDSAFQLAFVNADAPLTQGFTGAGVRLGFLDTLFDFSHPALAHVGAGGRLVAVRDFTGQPQANFHGLATTSVALGADDGDLVGPAYGAEVLAATTEYAPTETHAEEDFFIAGLEWMEQQGADVVSVSLGYQDFDPAGPGGEDYAYEDLDGDTTPFTRAVDRAASLGVLMVVAAGNEGNGFGHVGAPADADSALTVGAASFDSTRASFSSFGPTFDGRTKPDVAALGVGVHIAVPGGGYANSNGTSFATPMVAAVACQMLQANPALAPMDVIDMLRQTASQATAPDNLLGWGIIDAAAAVAATVDPLPSPTGDEATLAPNVARAGERVVLTLDGGGGRLTLDVVDLYGRRVAALVDGAVLDAGVTRLPLTVPRLAAGTYLVRVRTADRVASRVLVVR